jgi:hypothetical protein
MLILLQNRLSELHVFAKPNSANTSMFRFPHTAFAENALSTEPATTRIPFMRFALATGSALRHPGIDHLMPMR